MENADLAKQLKRLNRLSRAELTALSDSHQRATPNAVQLSSALQKLNDPNGVNYPTRSYRW